MKTKKFQNNNLLVPRLILYSNSQRVISSKSKNKSKFIKFRVLIIIMLCRTREYERRRNSNFWRIYNTILYNNDIYKYEYRI